MKKETDRSFYVTRDEYNWDSLRDKVMDCAGGLAFWNIDGTPVYIIEVHTEAYVKEGKVMNSLSVFDVKGKTISSADSADLDALVDETIAGLIKEKPAFIAMYTSRYERGSFPAGHTLYHDSFRPNPQGSLCLLGWIVDVSKYKIA